MTRFCRFCGRGLQGRQKYYCSRAHKDLWWSQKRREGAEDAEAGEALEDEVEHQRNCNRAFLEGIVKSGGNPLRVRIGELPYPEAVINPDGVPGS
jgi:hypothetical protein